MKRSSVKSVAARAAVIAGSLIVALLALSCDAAPDRIQHPTGANLAPAHDPVSLALAKLGLGRLQYSIPDEMEEGSTERVILAISSDRFADIEGELDPNPAPAESVPVSPIMSAILTGTGFDIEPLNSEKQVVSTEPTRWEWLVTPTQSAENILHLAVAVHIPVRDLGEGARDHTVFERNVSVNVNWPKRIKGFFTDNWQWFLTFLFGGALTSGVVVKARRRLRGKETPDEPLEH